MVLRRKYGRKYGDSNRISALGVGAALLALSEMVCSAVEVGGRGQLEAVFYKLLFSKMIIHLATPEISGSFRARVRSALDICTFTVPVEHPNTDATSGYVSC